MSRQHGLRYYIVLLAFGIVASVVTWVGAALGSGLAGIRSAPVIEPVDSALSSGLRLKPSGTAEVRSPLKDDSLPETEFFLVTRQSCQVPLGKTPLSTVPLFGANDRHGEWVVLAGVGMNDGTGLSDKGTVLIETQEGREPANLYFTVDLLFVPEGHWNVRASMAIDGGELYDAVAEPDHRLNPLHIGIAVAFDLGDQNPLVLDLGYGRMPLEGRLLSVQPDGGRPDQVLAETRIFSACLNIQF
jgi:hypothetical protein